MPTVEKLIKRAGYLIDDVMDVDLAIEMFNEALEEIDTVYGEAKKQTIPLINGQNTITIPKDVLEIVRVFFNLNGEEMDIRTDMTHYTYNRLGDELRIYPIPHIPMTVNIEYYGENEKIPSVSTDPSLRYIPKIPERFHRALPLYAAVRYFENWEDNPEMRSNYRKQFEAIRDDMAYQHERKVRGSKSSRVYTDRSWT